ncbi:MAG: hypothetical protein ABSA83_12730 [Verrucomicrobiota bacterium]|jgi:beta-glucosidase
MKLNRFTASLSGMLVAASLCAQTARPDSKMDAFISDLLSQMTLEEKIGQLNLLSTGFDVTGPVVSRNVEQSVRKGLAGGVFNLYGTARKGLHASPTRACARARSG